MHGIDKSNDDVEAVADADTSLRGMSRLFAEPMARMLLGREASIRRVEWGETQVVSRQRRLDRVLCVDDERGRRSLLHIEWTMRLNARVRERAAQYHMDAIWTARRDERQLPQEQRRRRVSVESMVVVLTGRKKRWPKYGKYQTSPKGRRFSGVRFRIEAVYQMTVRELEKKGELFWLVFVPLACDSDEPKLRQTVKRMRDEATEEEFVELIGAMLSMAQLKKNRPEFLDVIRAAAKEEKQMRHPWFVDGREYGLKEGLEQGREQGREQGIALVACMFERRLGRPLLDSERKRIVARLAKDGPEKLGAVVLDLSKPELAKWLEPRRKNKAA
jgi:predicted transposase YdaD